MTNADRETIERLQQVLLAGAVIVLQIEKKAKRAELLAAALRAARGD